MTLYSCSMYLGEILLPVYFQLALSVPIIPDVAWLATFKKLSQSKFYYLTTHIRKTAGK